MSYRWLAALGIVLAAEACFAQAPSDNPYRPVRGLADGGGRSVPGGDWARLPGGREMGPPASVHVDVDGESVWLSSAATRRARCRSRWAAASAWTV